MSESATTTSEPSCDSASYHHRIYEPDQYNWCVVPDTGFDAILFAGIAVSIACLVPGRFANSVVLLAGAAFMGVVMPVNLGRLGNATAIWLGVQPYELFFYVFLPPLLLDAAVRIDIFLFKKVVVQVLTLAFLVVGGSVGIMIPIMLYVMDLHHAGWRWQHVALFVSMLASTDAVAIIATMKTSGGPRRLRVLLEGEALFNDASSFTLFTIFLRLVEELNTDGFSGGSGWDVLGEVVKSALKLAAGGLATGLAFGIACRYALRLIRHLGASLEQQVALTFALGYLSYYVANSPFNFSGVVSVAVFGLYGGATSKWDMSAKVEESGAFNAFWDTLGFVVNAFVFFFSGVACINFFVRSSQDLEVSNHGAVLAATLWRLPIIYIFMFMSRFLLITLFRPLFKLTMGDISLKEAIFATAAGLRGSVSLILAQAVVTDAQAGGAGNAEVIKAEIVLWTAGFVLMTLLINVPLLPVVLRKTGLNKVSDGKQRMRRRAFRALQNHTASSINHLKQDEDEMLRGVDWPAVEKFVAVDDQYDSFRNPSLPPGAHHMTKWWAGPTLRTWLNWRREEKQLIPKRSSLMPVDSSRLDTEKFFGRSSGWAGPGDLESAIADDEDDKWDEEASSNEEANEDTISGGDVPFLGRQSLMLPTTTSAALMRSSTANPSPGISKSASFAGISRMSLTRPFSGASGANGSLLPTTTADAGLVTQKDGSGALADKAAKLDRQFQSGPNTILRSPFEPAGPVPKIERLTPPASKSSSGEPVRHRSGSVNLSGNYVMTSAGPLPAPMPLRRSRTLPQGGQQEQGALRHDSPSSLENLPKLRISGDALRKLVSEGTTGKTWPKAHSKPSTAGRPPLPWKTPGSPELKTQRSLGTAAPKLPKEAEEENVASTSTWGGALNSLPSSQSTWRRSQTTQGGNVKRPSVFDAFDIERPKGLHAARSVAKHKSIYDAFGISDGGSPSANLAPANSLARQTSTRSAGSGGSRLESGDLASPQQTWTAGMTKGVAPPELIAQLKRNRSAPSLDKQEEAMQAEFDNMLARESSAALTPSEGGSRHGPSGIELIAKGNEHEDTTGMAHLTESEIEEARIRLVVGLKRYFHGKRLEGLLSNSALRVLDNVCDGCLEDPQSLDLWDKLERDSTGTKLVSFLAHQVYFWRKVVILLTRRRAESYKFFNYTRRAIAFPIRKALGLGQSILSKYMLIGIEVAMEYMLGLTFSPQVQLLKRQHKAMELLEEVQSELDKVWKFILDREVEAPDRFQAIQSYRATMAILKQQIAFIKTMFETGVVDDTEKEQLIEPIDLRERHLERAGPIWRSPSVVEVLQNLPFLREVPKRVVEILYRHGQLQMYRSQAVLPHKDSGSIFIVTSGLVKVTYSDPQSHVQKFFLATGGMVGLYQALTGVQLPGKVEAVAEGNAMGKGPIIFELYQSGINLIRKHAAAGNEIFQQVELDMMRLAALFIVGRLKPRLMPYLMLLISQQLQAGNKFTFGDQTLRPGDLDDDPGTPRVPGNLKADSIFSKDSELQSAQNSQDALHDATLDAHHTLLRELASSEMLELPPGVAYIHRSSAVLLRGTLKTSGRRYVEGGRKGVSAGSGEGEEMGLEYHAPFVFPWVGPPAESSAAALRFVAGYTSGQQPEGQGALLMVCRHPNLDDGEPDTSGRAGMEHANAGSAAAATAPEAASEAAAEAAAEVPRQQAAEEAELEEAALEEAAEGGDMATSLRRISQVPKVLMRHSTIPQAAEGASPMPRPVARSSVGPNLRRVTCRALVLNANDTGELAPPVKQEGKSAEWWENAHSRNSMMRVNKGSQ